MHQFCGELVYFPSIRIDNFIVDSNVSIYFLSHKHMDHMYGLDTPEFFSYISNLQSNNGYQKKNLYCSTVTKMLLYNDPKYTHISKLFTSLPLFTNIFLAQNLMIKLLPAGHCPGSVMFILDNFEKRILYTGDFRFGLNSESNLTKIFPENIDAIYLDTTFASMGSTYIPSREESLNVVQKLVKKWLSHTESQKRFVRLNLIYDIGYEPLYKYLHDSTGHLIHVSSYQYEYYRDTNIQHYLTLDPFVTPIHACRSKPSNTILSECNLDANIILESEKSVNNLLPKLCSQIPFDRKIESNLMVIQPSVMWWNHTVTTKQIVSKVGNFYRLCYSMHPSYGELVKLLQTFNSNIVIYPIVKPRNMSWEKLNDILYRALTPLKNKSTMNTTHLANNSSTLSFSQPLAEKNIIEPRTKKISPIKTKAKKRTKLTCFSQDSSDQSNNSHSIDLFDKDVQKELFPFYELFDEIKLEPYPESLTTGTNTTLKLENFYNPSTAKDHDRISISSLFSDESDLLSCIARVCENENG